MREADRLLARSLRELAGVLDEWPLDATPVSKLMRLTANRVEALSLECERLTEYREVGPPGFADK